MTLKYFNTKNVLKAVLELLLEAKNTRTSVRTIPVHLNSPRSDRGLLEFKAKISFEDRHIGKNRKRVHLTEIFCNIKHFSSEITLTGPWSLQIVARPHLTSNNSVCVFCVFCRV